MKNINQFKSRKEWASYVWSKLLENIKNPALSAILNSLLSSYEKENIIKRLAALSLIKKGKSYKQIGEELWLSPTTIRCLRKTLESNSAKEYQSYRFRKNKRIKKEEKRKTKEAKKFIPGDSDFLRWIDYYVSVFPRKTGPRWKYFR